MTCANTEVGHFTPREMPIIQLGERGRQSGPAGRPRLGGRRRGVREDALPAADSRLVLSPRDRARAGPRRRHVAQGCGRDVQSVAALVPVAGPASPPAVAVRRAAGVGGRQQPALPALSRPGRPVLAGNAVDDHVGQAGLALGPRGPYRPGCLVRAEVAGHRGGQQGDYGRQRGADPVAVTAEFLLPVPAALPGRQGRPVAVVPGDRGRQQPRALRLRRAWRRG